MQSVLYTLHTLSKVPWAIKIDYAHFWRNVIIFNIIRQHNIIRKHIGAFVPCQLVFENSAAVEIGLWIS